MEKSTFEITRMDCSAEEQMVRMKLDGQPGVKHLDFDLPNRKLTVLHNGTLDEITKSIADLNLNSSLVNTEQVEDDLSFEGAGIDKRLLYIVLGINAAFFLIEIIAGFISKSMGLVADSLDMLADAIVYAMSLFAVAGTVTRKKNIARLSGYFQLALAILGFVEVVRRFLGAEAIPNFQTMIYVSLFALIGNAASLYILQKSKSKEAHMQASLIFTSNDVIANLGVMAAGIIVYFTGSNLPDLIIGTLVFILVGQGAFRILKLAK